MGPSYLHHDGNSGSRLSEEDAEGAIVAVVEIIHELPAASWSRQRTGVRGARSLIRPQLLARAQPLCPFHPQDGAAGASLPIQGWPPTGLQHRLLGNDVDSGCEDRLCVEAARLRDDLHATALGEGLGQGGLDPFHQLGQR